VALLVNPGEPSAHTTSKKAEPPPAALSLTVSPFELRSLDEAETVFARMAQAGVQALTLGPGGLLFQGRDKLAKFALAHRMPVCGWSRETLVSGLLLSYGPDLVQIVRQARHSLTRFCMAPSRANFRSNSRHVFSSSSISGPPRC
jgi:hypothetical protein